jgi:hypothetical protein
MAMNFPFLSAVTVRAVFDGVIEQKQRAHTEHQRTQQLLARKQEAHDQRLIDERGITEVQAYVAEEFRTQLLRSKGVESSASITELLDRNDDAVAMQHATAPQHQGIRDSKRMVQF